jgi:DNA-binding IclR family transcriptional regulator
VATAFLDVTGKPYALSVPAPRSRFEQNRAEFEKSLLEMRDYLVQQVMGSLPDIR